MTMTISPTAMGHCRRFDFIAIALAVKFIGALTDLADGRPDKSEQATKRNPASHTSAAVVCLSAEDKDTDKSYDIARNRDAIDTE